MLKQCVVLIAAATIFLMGSPPSQAAANLQGRVFADLNENVFLDPGEPCVSARVMLQPAVGPPEMSDVVCDGLSPGSFHFDAVQAGEYDLLVYYRNGEPLGVEEKPVLTFHVNIPEGVPYVVQDLPLPPLPSDQPLSVVPSIRGQVLRLVGATREPLAGVVVALQNTSGGVLALTTTDTQGAYEFTGLAQDIYHVVVTDAQGARDTVEPSTAGVDSNTLQVRVTLGATAEGNNFIRTGEVVRGLVQRLQAIGDTVAGLSGRLSILRNDQHALDRDVTRIRRIRSDGSLYVADYEGTALFRFDSNGPQNLFDTTGGDRTAALGVARFGRIETNSSGQSAILAVKANNTRGIYRLDGSVPTQLNDSSGADTLDPAELAMSDRGQAAYVARRNVNGGSALVVRQTLSGSGTAFREVNLENTRALRISNLLSNSTGDLAFRIEFAGLNGVPTAVIVRQRNGEDSPQVAAFLGQSVAAASNPVLPAVLTQLQRPRIGSRPLGGDPSTSDGAVVFQGSSVESADGRPLPGGRRFENFYISRPGSGGRLEALLPAGDWSRDPTTFDYDVDPNGVVALRAESSQSQVLVVIRQDGQPRSVNLARADGRPRYHVEGQPMFAPGWLFFLATDVTSLPDRNGRLPVGLYRVRVINGTALTTPVAVAVPGGRVPRTGGAQLLGVTQQPVLSETEIAFGVLFQGGQLFSGGVRFRIPTPGILRLKLGDVLPLDQGQPDVGELDIREGTLLPNANQLAGFRGLRYTANRSLVYDSVLPGAGPLADRPGRSLTRSQMAPGRTAAVDQAGTINDPLLPTGASLGDGRTLEAQLSAVVALPSATDTFIFVAKFSKDGGTGEGIFTLRLQNGQRDVQPVALTGAEVTDWPGPPVHPAILGLGDQPGYKLKPLSVSADGNVVFKALVEVDGPQPGSRARTFAVFQWRQTSPPSAPTFLGASEEVLGKDSLRRWAAGLSSNAYYLTRSPSAVRLNQKVGASIQRILPPNLNPLQDFVVNGAGKLFASDAATALPGVLVRIDTPVRAGDPLQVQRIAEPGKQAPRGVGGSYAGYLFDGSFTLQPQLACSDLYFIAGVTKGATSGRGFFHVGSDGTTVDTMLIEEFSAGHNSVSKSWIPEFPEEPCNRPAGSPSISQAAGGVLPIVFAIYSGERDGWTIYRYMDGVFTVVASEKERLSGDRRRYYLDAGPMSGLAPGSGPEFTIDATGEVAFLASDGQRWGVYRFSPSGDQPQ
jgi:hypothetical protein